MTIASTDAAPTRAPKIRPLAAPIGIAALPSAPRRLAAARPPSTVAAAAATPTAVAAPAGGDREHVTEGIGRTTLDSGLRVVTEAVSGLHSVTLGAWVASGARDEDHALGEWGASHFLEHLLFKGSERFSALEAAEIFDGLGGELNAATARDYTVVYARVLDEHLETAFDVMSDMVFAPTLADLD